MNDQTNRNDQEQYPQYAVLFGVLDAIGATLHCVWNIPSFIWLGLSLAYICTIYRAYWKIQEARHLRRILSR